MKNKLWKKVVIVLLVISILGISFDSTNNPFETIMAIAVIALIIYFIRKRKVKLINMKNDLPSASPTKNQHYHDLGMDDQQIKFFRSTMNTTKEQVVQLELNMNSVSKLKAINLRNDTVRLAKGLFKELVKSPTKLHLADGFLYNHLPNLVELTAKYIEINQHDVKTKNSFEALEKSAKMIDEVSKLLLADYEKIVADDLEDLDVELTLAEQNIARNQPKHEVNDVENDTDIKE